MKSVAAVLVVLAGLLVGCGREPLEKRLQNLQQQVTLLKDDHGTGSGFVVVRENARGEHRVFLWTAAHVIEQSPKQQVIRLFHFDGRKGGNATFKGRVIVYSRKHDLALLLVDCPADFFRTTKFASRDARLGDPVIVVGNPHGADYDGSVHFGTVSQVGINPGEGWPWSIDLDQTTAIIVPGNSGGPVFNKDGEVVGVAVGWARMPGIGAYVPLRQIEDWAARGGMLWAIRGSYCPSDDILEKHIAISAHELAPPPEPPVPVIVIPPLDILSVPPILPDPPVIPVPICP